MVQIKVTQPMRQAASVMNLNPRVPHMYFEFIMHTMVNHTHTTFPSAQNAMEKALTHGGLVCLPWALPRRVVMLCVSRRRDSARVYRFTLKHDLLKRNLSIEAKFIPQLNTLKHDLLKRNLSIEAKFIPQL